MEQNKSQVDEKVLHEGPLVTISIKDLHKSYGKKEVLKGLDLEVYEGDLFGHPFSHACDVFVHPRGLCFA